MKLYFNANLVIPIQSHYYSTFLHLFKETWLGDQTPLAQKYSSLYKIVHQNNILVACFSLLHL
jgi:hypothetical protein